MGRIRRAWQGLKNVWKWRARRRAAREEQEVDRQRAEWVNNFAEKRQETRTKLEALKEEVIKRKNDPGSDAHPTKMAVWQEKSLPGYVKTLSQQPRIKGVSPLESSLEAMHARYRNNLTQAESLKDVDGQVVSLLKLQHIEQIIISPKKGWEFFQKHLKAGWKFAKSEKKKT